MPYPIISLTEMCHNKNIVACFGTWQTEYDVKDFRRPVCRERGNFLCAKADGFVCGTCVVCSKTKFVM